MKTEWLNESEQSDADAAHDAAQKKIEALTADYKLECQRTLRTRDRVEAKILDRVASRIGVPVAALQPVRDGQQLPIGVTFEAAGTVHDPHG